MKTSRALHHSDHRAQAFLNGIKGFRKIKKHNQIGHAFVNVKIPIKENHGKQTDRPRLYGENLSRVEWSPSLPRQLQRHLRKKLPFCPVQKLTTALAHALIVSP